MSAFICVSVVTFYGFNILIAITGFEKESQKKNGEGNDNMHDQRNDD